MTTLPWQPPLPFTRDQSRRSKVIPEPSQQHEKTEPPGREQGSDDGNQQALHNGAFLQSPTGSEFLGPGNYDAQLAAFASDEERFLPGSTYDEILKIIQKYVTRERSQRVWRGSHFFVSVAISIGCWIAVWFSPANFVAFILMLVSSLGLVAGTMDGLLSLFFFNWELRALKEFEWEMLNAKAIMSGGPTPEQDVRGSRGRSW